MSVTFEQADCLPDEKAKELLQRGQEQLLKLYAAKRELRDRGLSKDGCAGQD